MSREAILAALRASRVEPAPLPPPWCGAGEGDDLESRFVANLEAAGGGARLLAGREDLAPALADLEASLGVRRDHVAAAPWLPALDAGAAGDARLELAVVAGEFAVAENGGVWVLERELHRRAPLFLARHVALLVPRSALLPDLHAAFGALAEDRERGFGVLVAGPSKTADIERTLVIGAHAATSTTVLLIGDGA
jgi:L-lactate dehydrogenase complex protein LldG